jgi:peptide subunit release factor 1 (eRF1)
MTLDLLPPPAARQTTDDAVLDTLLHRLLAIKPGPHRVVSCYLRLTRDERLNRRYLTVLKNRIRAVHDEAAAPDLSRILEYVTSARTLPHAAGLAIFACEALHLFEAVPLGRVHRTRVVVDDTPHVLELIALRQELGAVLATVFDRSHARFFLVGEGSARELEGLIQTSRRGGAFDPDREDAPGWGERDYHHRLREERHRHCAAIAYRLQRLIRTHSARGIVLAGARKEVAALMPFLPRDVAGRVFGTTVLNPTAVSPAEVQVAALAIAGEHDRAEELRVVSSVAESIGAGWAVEGPRDALRALARGQVRTLLVRADLEGPGFRCSASGRLVLAKGDCRGEGEPRPVLDVVDEAVEEALRQGIEVVVVHDREAAEEIDGLAAILRFR